MSKIKVAVIFGGASSEHDISLISATNVIENMPKDKYEAICIGITKKGRWLYYPGDVSNIASGEWEKDPDCSSAVISPDPLHKGVITLENGEYKTERCARMRFAVSVQEPVHELMGYGPAFAHFAVFGDRARLQIVFPLRLLATVCDQRRFGTKQLVELFGQSVHGRSGL